MSEVTAEICEGMSFTKGTVWVLQVWTDRKPAARGGLTKGKTGGALVAESIPELLRDAAAFMEQEGIESLKGLLLALVDAYKRGQSFERSDTP